MYGEPSAAEFGTPSLVSCIGESREGILAAGMGSTFD